MESKKSTPEELKLKVLGDFLLCDRFDEITDFSIFKICLGYLFKKEEQWLKNIFDYLVGTFKDTMKKRKYLSFTRLYEAYLNFKMNKEANEDISLFFNELINSKDSIIKIPDTENKISIGKDGKNEFISNMFSKGELFFISRLVVLKKGDGKIAGLNIYYNNSKEYKIEMHNEKGLKKALDIKLENSQNDNINIYYKDIEITNSITHIFGTFDETITSIGFKCSSGKIYYFGEQNGKPFLFGCFGNKIQCLNINIEEKGISKLEAYFTKNKNANKHIEYKKDDINKLFYDENILENNDDNYNLLRNTRILNFGKNNSQKDIENQTTITKRNINPNFSINPNPFLNFVNNDICIPNPFFTKKLEETKAKHKGTQIAVSIGSRVKLNESVSNILKIQSTKSDSTNERKKEKIRERLINLYEKLKDNIYKSTLKLFPEEKKNDIKKYLNQILKDEDDATNINNIEKVQEEKEKEEQEQEKEEEEKKEEEEEKQEEKQEKQEKEEQEKEEEEEEKEEEREKEEQNIDNENIDNENLDNDELNSNKDDKNNKKIEAFNNIMNEFNFEDKDIEKEKEKIINILIEKDDDNSIDSKKSLDINILNKFEEEFNKINEDEKNDENDNEENIDLNSGKESKENSKQEIKEINEPDEKERESNEIKDINEIKDEIIINKSNIKSNQIKETDKKINKNTKKESSKANIIKNTGKNVKKKNIFDFFHKVILFLNLKKKKQKTEIKPIKIKEESDSEEDNCSNEENGNIIKEIDEEEKIDLNNLQDLNKNLNENIINIRNNYDLEKEKEENEEKTYNDFIILEEEKKNILVKPFYNNYNQAIKIFKNQELPKELQIWTDELFKKEKKFNLFKKIEWYRPSEINDKKYYIIKNKPEIRNIRQSKNIKDRYFFSALGALCEKCKNTDIIKNLFYITETTKEKAYGVYFYIKGIRQLILIDDYFLYSFNNDIKKMDLYYSSSYEESELWVSLLEKAWAKLKGSYKNVDKGTVKEAFYALTGAYTKQVKIKPGESENIWNILNNNKDYSICATLEKEYEYILIETIEDKKNKIRKIKLKQPYGDIDNKIVKILTKDPYSFIDGNGIFIINYQIFVKNFDLLDINYFKPGKK